MTQDERERDEWLRTDQYRGVSKWEIRMYPERYDLPPFACKHQHRESRFVEGVAMCSECKRHRREWLEKLEEESWSAAPTGILKYLRDLGWPGAGG